MSEETEMPIPEMEESGVSNGVASMVEGERVMVENSMVGGVNAGQDVSLANSLTFAVNAGGNFTTQYGFDGLVNAGGNMDQEYSGSLLVNVAKNADIKYGGAGVMVCQQAAVEQGSVGVLLAGKVTLGENTKVMMTTKEAIAFGAAFGLVAAVLGIIFRRRK